MGFRSSRGKLCGFLVCFGLVCLFLWSVWVVIRTSVWEQPGADGCDARGLVEKGKGERRACLGSDGGPGVVFL